MTGCVNLRQYRPADVGALTAFLREVDLTLSGLDESSVRLWVERDRSGEIVGSTGYEVSRDGHHALIRSVAVSPAQRSRGRGRALAMFALERAAEEGSTRAWLFSRRSGPFWQGLGFESADRGDLAEVLADSHQVRLFRQSGQLAREVAWSRPLSSGRDAQDELLFVDASQQFPHDRAASTGTSDLAEPR
ncbi:GNAT family N-acetyltransferase [Brachybacterium alimentarium]|nr:GNAT family N-acetyltransferase [Brachybacterium alimentarium]